MRSPYEIHLLDYDKVDVIMVDCHCTKFRLHRKGRCWFQYPVGYYFPKHEEMRAVCESGVMEQLKLERRYWHEIIL